MAAELNVSVDLPSALWREAERIATQEGRTGGDLLAEALRRYLVRSRFLELQSYGAERAAALCIQQDDVERLIAEVRREDACAAGQLD